MKMTKLGKALTVALQAASPKLAQDKALVGLVGEADKKLDKAETVKKLIAMDVEMTPEKLDAIIDAILDVEQSPQAMEPAVDDEPEDMPDATVPPPAEDDGGAAKLAEFLASKGMSDEDVKAACALLGGGSDAYDENEVEKKAEEKAKEKIDHAMDSLRKEFRQLEKAKQDQLAKVAPVAPEVKDPAAPVTVAATPNPTPDSFGGIHNLSIPMFRKYMIPFELVSVLLTVAVRPRIVIVALRASVYLLPVLAVIWILRRLGPRDQPRSVR